MGYDSGVSRGIPSSGRSGGATGPDSKPPGCAARRLSENARFGRRLTSGRRIHSHGAPERCKGGRCRSKEADRVCGGSRSDVARAAATAAVLCRQTDASGAVPQEGRIRTLGAPPAQARLPLLVGHSEAQPTFSRRSPTGLGRPASRRLEPPAQPWPRITGQPAWSTKARLSASLAV